MKAVREHNKKPEKAPSGCRSKNGAKKVRRTGGQSLEITGQRECGLLKKEGHASPCCATNGMQDSFASLPSTKIKLQLYPVDEGTRIGLEKDGIHPYLELTLRPMKRISSVLKHLNNKWGSSKVALGDLVLLPYNTCGDISHCRMWTMKDSDIRAGDIYASFGSPAIFRLRYGWVSPSKLMTSEETSAPSISYNLFLQSEDAQKACNSDVKIPDKDGVQLLETSENIKLINDDGQRTNNEHREGQLAALWVNDLSNISIGALLSEASLHAKLNSCKPKSTGNDVELQPARDSHSKTMLPWDDSLTNISIGGLLYEISLQGQFTNENNTKSISGIADLQSIQIISDSLDAFISAQSGCPQGPRPPAHDSHTSILDGDETCHAFSAQKFSSSRKRVSALSGSSRDCSQDAGSKSFKFPKHDEMNTQVGVSEDQACQVGVSRTYNDGRSLGLANIKWSDSLGPFDLGLSASGKLTKEEIIR